MARDSEALLLQLSADIRGLEKQFAKANGIVDKGSRAMERRAQQASTSLERFFGKTDPAKALDKVFDSTRFRVLDSGVARIGLMGSALESLGPAGLAAAAGIGATAAAFAGARQAASFADELSDTADKLHITTDALQEYRYAIRAAGGDEKAAEEALASFSVLLGKAAQDDMPKAQRGFLKLGFTKEQIRGFTDVETTLPKVAAAMAGLSDAQRDAAASMLGLDGLRLLLDKGPEQMQRLLSEARNLGLVMDADLVKRGAELNDQFETVAKVIDIQLKSALVDVGPLLLDLLKLMAQLASEAADVADAFKSIENRRTSALKEQRASFAKGLANPALAPLHGHYRRQIADIDAELASRAASPPTPPRPPRKTLQDLSTTPPVRDTTDERTASVDALLAAAKRAQLQAQLALTDDAEARARLERQITEQELARTLAGLDRQKADLADDKGISDATRARLTAEVERAADAERAAAASKLDLIDREAVRASSDQWFEAQQEIGANLDRVAEVAAAEAGTARERLAIELRSLDARQRLERSLQQELLARKVADGQMLPGMAAQVLQSADEARAAERSQLIDQGAGPVQQYLRSIQDLNSEFENAGVAAAQSLSAGLADAIVNAKDLGDVASQVFRQLIQQVLSAVIEKNVVAPIMAAVLGIPAFAAGTNSAPGGLSLVGEDGPEVVNLRRGSQVIPNHMLNAMARMAVPSGSAGAGPSIYADFRGAVVTEELMATFMKYADSVGARAKVEGAALGHQQTMTRLAKRRPLGRPR